MSSQKKESFRSALPRRYRRACRLAEDGRYNEARRAFGNILDGTAGTDLKALVLNDLVVLDAVEGRTEDAYAQLSKEMNADGACIAAALNRDLLVADGVNGLAGLPRHEITEPPFGAPKCSRTRVALVSFLFNWPSTGGGNIHTVELGRWLKNAGYEVLHIYPSFAPWGIGSVTSPLAASYDPVPFDEADWNASVIQARFRRAVDAFGPDFVIISDAWNMKPVLAEAVRDLPYFLRFQALECLCPLNNLRLLAGGADALEQCPRHQLATPAVCRRCVAERANQSGPLHQLERSLAGIGTPVYELALREALEGAAAVLTLNPLTAEMLRPYSRRVLTIPWGMDAARFPWSAQDEVQATSGDGPVTLFMAAVAGEFIKGFHVAQQACRMLRRERSDFELVVTFEPSGRIDEFTRSVGWQSQEDLPRHYRAAGICLVPTVAQEGLSRTSVEAMAAGIPVVASRIGGLPYTVTDGVTGLLCEPGDPADLAAKVRVLLDDPALRRRMGLAGRRRFEQEFTWEVVIERHYRPLLARTAAKI